MSLRLQTKQKIEKESDSFLVEANSLSSLILKTSNRDILM